MLNGEAKQKVLEYIKTNDKGRGVSSHVIKGVFNDEIPFIDRIYDELLDERLIKDTGYGNMVNLTKDGGKWVEVGYPIFEEKKQARLVSQLKIENAKDEAILHNAELAKKQNEEFVSPKKAYNINRAAIIISVISLCATLGFSYLNYKSNNPTNRIDQLEIRLDSIIKAKPVSIKVDSDSTKK